MMFLRRFITSLAAAALALAAAAISVSDIPDVHLADNTRFVSDPAGVLDRQSVTALDSALARLRRTYTVQGAVVVAPGIDGGDIDGFANSLFDAWHLGAADRDNGLLLVLDPENRKITIRTGYGLEGILPDAVCSRIIRNVIVPQMRQGDYARGLADGISVISAIIADPDNAAEIASEIPDRDRAASSGDEDPFRIYLTLSALLAGLMLFYLLARLYTLRGKPDFEKYAALSPVRPIYLVLTFAGLGIPAVASVPLVLLLSHWRNRRRKCPNCGTPMDKVDEVHDNDYLTPAQDLEEKVGSVDYDVWLCPSCGETDIYPFVNSASGMVECPQCHARTARLVRDRIISRPTASREGTAVKEYECLNCHHNFGKPYKLPPDNSAALAALGAAAVIGSSGRRGGGFGGGGFGGPIGGSWGGGSTGGGGATGSW